MNETVKHIDPDMVRDALDYDPDTGVFKYKQPKKTYITNLRARRGWATANVGRVAGVVTNKGYVSIFLFGAPYLAHRIAWVYMTGAQPKDQIDHVDGDKQNNEWANLRECDNRENCKNQKLRANNGTGITGVRINTDKYGKKWIAAIGNTYLGSFDDFFEACCARKSAENKLNYHPNHGRQAA